MCSWQMKVAIILVASFSCLLQGFIFLFFRSKSANHISHVESYQKTEHHLSLTSKVHNHKFFQLSKIRSEFFNTCRDEDDISIDYYNNAYYKCVTREYSTLLVIPLLMA